MGTRPDGFCSYPPLVFLGWSVVALLQYLLLQFEMVGEDDVFLGGTFFFFAGRGPRRSVQRFVDLGSVLEDLADDVCKKKRIDLEFRLFLDYYGSGASLKVLLLVQSY